MALCVAYGFASAQAAIFSAAEAARFHTGERHMYPRPARLHLVKLRFARLRSAKHYFRSSSPSMPHDHAAGTRRSRLATLAPPAVKVFFNTILQQSGGKRVVDKTAKPMKSFSVPPPFREGQSARPLSVGCFSPSADGATVD